MIKKRCLSSETDCFFNKEGDINPPDKEKAGKTKKDAIKASKIINQHQEKTPQDQ